MKIVVCIKQVPQVTELPWDSKTGTLRREQAEGMMNPACRHALEAALLLRQEHGGHITALSMGPPQAQEVLQEALALGADRGVLLSDARLAGADTLATSYTLAKAIRTILPDFDLVLCGCSSSDSETGQVGPQMAEDLDIPGAANVDQIVVQGEKLRLERLADDFFEVLEMDLPGLITVTTRGYTPRHTPLAGLEAAFASSEVITLNARGIGADPLRVGLAGSAMRILKVWSPTAKKRGLVLTGTAKKTVESLLDQFSDKLGGLIGQDLKPGTQRKR